MTSAKEFENLCNENKDFLFVYLMATLEIAFEGDVNAQSMHSGAKFDCLKFMKVKMRFYASLPVGVSQSQGFHAAATGWPLETLHAEQQNGRPSTD